MNYLNIDSTTAAYWVPAVQANMPEGSLALWNKFRRKHRVSVGSRICFIWKVDGDCPVGEVDFVDRE